MILTDSNFLIYAAQNYRNYNCDDTQEFLEDLNRIKYIKKLFTFFQNKDELNINLILNHITILYNVFESRACTKMLFFKLPYDHWSFLKSILCFTGHLPDLIRDIGDENTIIEIAAIPYNKRIYEAVKEIVR